MNLDATSRGRFDQVTIANGGMMVQIQEESLLFKKIFGCILGGAIGDALGGPVEGMHYTYIRELYGGRITDIHPYDRPDEFFQAEITPSYTKSSQAGAYTDDTYFQHLITKTIIAKGGRISADDLARTWLQERDEYYYWYNSTNAYMRIALGQRPVREAGIGSIDENSAAMCIGPIGVINAGDPEQAALDAYDVVSIWHDGFSREAACVIAAAVAEAMSPTATVDSIVKSSVANLPNKETSLIYGPVMEALDLASGVKDTEEFTERFYERMLIPWIRRGVRGAESGESEDDERHSSSLDPRESIPCTMAMFSLTGGHYREGVIAGANFGRDCDTIACMLGYIAGALHGIDAIPDPWVSASLEANPDPDQKALAMGLAETLMIEKQRSQARVSLIASLEDPA